MKPMKYSNERWFEILIADSYKNIPYWVISYGTHPCAYIDITSLNIFDDIYIDCHGGITYTEDFLRNVWDEANPDFEHNKRKFIGWDYAHCDDFCGALQFNPFGNRKYTTEEIINEIKTVIDNLIN